MRGMSRWLAALAWLCCGACWADQDCDSALVEKVRAAAPDGSADTPGTSCKALPGDAARTLMLYNKLLLLVDSADGRILAKGGSVADVGSPVIDTARYILDPQTRAFGLSQSVNQSHWQGGSQFTELSLYVIDGAQIRPVLENLAIGETDIDTECADYDKMEGCSDTTRTDNTTISVAKTAHHGYADLLLVSTSSCSGDCDTGKKKKARKPAKKVGTLLLQYDGSRYVVPADWVSPLADIN